MSECIFCSIIAGKIPAKKLDENEDVVAFLDINPRSKGHTIIVPKVHAATLTDLPAEKMLPLFEQVQSMAAKIISAFEADGYNIGINNGESAGQAVAHIHVHIIPRYKTDQHHAGFEAAFPIDEESKKTLDVIFKEFNEKSISSEDGSHHSKKKEPAKDEHNKPEHVTDAKKSKEKWKFLGKDYIEED